jgi:hypothetical protein
MWHPSCLYRFEMSKPLLLILALSILSGCGSGDDDRAPAPGSTPTGPGGPGVTAEAMAGTKQMGELPPTRTELCAAVEPSGSGTIFIPPEPACQQKPCGSACEPCAGKADCSGTSADHACSRDGKCVKVRE